MNLGIMGGMLKSFIPMVKSNLTELDKAICEKMASVQRQENEAYVSINGVNEEGKIIFYLCTCSADDQVIRQLERIPLDELILNLLQKC